MKHTLLIFFFFGITASHSQSAEDSVKAAINQFFNGMKNADAILLKASFTDSAILQSVAVDKEGKVVIKNEPVAGFISMVSSLPKDAADEQIQFDIIRIDGALAIAWTPYKFYFKGKFSHCGVDSYQLVRIGGTWKIQYIIDTRRKEGCE